MWNQWKFKWEIRNSSVPWLMQIIQLTRQPISSMSMSALSHQKTNSVVLFSVYSLSSNIYKETCKLKSKPKSFRISDSLLKRYLLLPSAASMLFPKCNSLMSPTKTWEHPISSFQNTFKLKFFTHPLTTPFLDTLRWLLKSIQQIVQTTAMEFIYLLF